MSVYFKFKSAKDFNSIPIEGQFISIGTLKERIFELKHLGRGTDFDLVVSNAQSNEEYTDEAALIPRNTSVLIRRVPGRPRMPILAEPDEVKAVEDNTQNVTPATSNAAAQFSPMNPEDSEWDEFGNDPYAIIPEGQPAQSFNPTIISSSDKLDEDSKIRALVETPSLDWTSQNDGYRGGRGYGRGMGGRMMGGRGFGRGGLFEHRNPPPGYICHRCKVPGHFIQHCPTNGNPAYDVKRVKPPTGIPKSMLMATPDGSYALPNGSVAVLQPNEAAFEKEIEGIPSSSRAVTVPAELLPENLRCPLCKEAMKDAVLTSKCCFMSFCDKCIRDHIINLSRCVCGATNVLADDLIPNRTLREAISKILESATSSQEKGGSFVQVQDMQSAVPVQEKVPSPAVSASKEGAKGPALLECYPEAANTSGVKAANGEDFSSERKMKALVACESTPDSRNGKDPMSPKKSPLMKDNAGKPPPGDQAKKKKKKKQRPGDEMQWRQYQEMGGVDGFGGMQMQQIPGPGSNPFFGGAMPPMAVDPFMGAAPFAGHMGHFMGLPPGPFGGVFPPVPDPFMAQPYMNMNMMPPAPRDLAELALGNVGMNMRPRPMMRREEDFDGRRVDFRRRRDMERPSERSDRERIEYPRDRDARRERKEISSARDVSPINKHKISTSSQAAARPERSDRPDRATTQEREHRAKSQDSSHRHSSPRRSKKRSSADEAPTPAPPAAADLSPPSKKLKGSVFSRISFPEGGSTSKKAKVSESEVLAPLPPPLKKSSGSGSRAKDDRFDPAPSKDSRHRSKRSYDEEEDESSDEDRHFKRRSRRKDADADVAAEERRQSRFSKEHERTYRHRD